MTSPKTETPRTDALIPSQSFVDQTRLFDREWFCPLLDLSRTLERENAALREKLEQAEQRERELLALIKEAESWVQAGEGVPISYYIENNAVKARWDAALNAEGNAT